MCSDDTRGKSSGFTLVELAIVLVIVGIMVGVGSSMVGVLSTAVKVRETKETLEASLQSLTSYAAGSNTLPNNSASFASTVRSPQDAWGRDILYLYDASLYRATPTKDTICGRRTTSLSLQTLDPAATISNVAFVLLSAGDDASVQATLNGNTIPLATRSSAAGRVIIDGANSDIARWVTLDELRSKMGCQGGQLKIINNEMPFGNYSTSYTAAFTPDGGTGTVTGTYQWRVKSARMPRGVSFSPDMGTVPSGTYNIFSNNSTSNNGIGGWNSAPSLQLSGRPWPAGSYNITVQVKDSDGNTATKPFVFTVNPN